MIVILSHRQMDFDALSSMAAARKLYPGSIMVADGKPSSSVQDFLALAKEQIPFKRLHDIDWTRVTKIILVDTNDFYRAAGLRKSAELENIPKLIFDHHPYAAELKPGMVIESVGASTTLLVERLQEMKITLSSFEATLFALGIYEDTGSLTFESTSVRDVKAIAYLLEAGANLGVVSEYLHKPLTEEQKDLLQHLLDRGEKVAIEGISVYISSAVSDDYVGGLALLAHRVGEMEGPETLFLVVQMDTRIYIVGRSRGRGLPVNLIVQAFGGGGHNRAASATIKDASMEEVLARLRTEIKERAYTPNLARDIMSYPVKVVSPETKLSEVMQMLLKYGHTGVPVAVDQKLVGIISRRDVDKALKHGLEHAPVTGFMTKSVVTVGPEASWEEVQRLMVQHDIGRVPVVEDGRIIGIVSRSDILRLVHGRVVPTEAVLTKDRSHAMREDILKLLQNLPENIRYVFDATRSIGDRLGYSVYVVGGFVRDLLLHIPTQDLDFVVEGDSHEFARELIRTLNRGHLTLHEQFGTARIEFPDGTHLDVAKSRWEYYEFPGALPQVEESRLREDMFRRDFTINAMAIALDAERYGEMIDYYGGLRDLNQGEIRFMHNLSFIEDPTRIIRAVRFAGRYSFRLNKETREGIGTALRTGVLHKLSAERFSDEIMILLHENNFAVMGKMLEELGVLRVWFRQDYPWDFTQSLLDKAHTIEKKWLIVIHAMDYEQTHQVIEALRLNKYLRMASLKYAELVSLLSSCSPLSKERLDEQLREMPDWLIDVLLLHEKLETPIRDYLRAAEKIQSRLDGKELRRLGVNEGKQIGDILSRVRLAWLEGQIVSLDAEHEWVKQLIHTQN